MEFNEAVLKRRSIRSYSSAPVTDDELVKILEAARLAPSAMHRQPWHFIVVRDAETRKRLAGGQSFAANAPVIIVALGDPKASPSWWQNDVGIAFEHIILAASSLGLGTCWLGAMVRDTEIKDILQIPDSYRVVAISPIGVPAENPVPKQRKRLDEIVSWEKFGNNSSELTI
jgi:nitroreductase